MRWPTNETPNRRTRIRQGCLVLLVTSLGLLVRFIAIGSLPPGLYRDEAQNGLDALMLLGAIGSVEGPSDLFQLPLFFNANNGREPLFIYLLALSVRAFGRSPGALRAVAAACGAATVPATYWLGRELYGHREGLLAATLATTTVWLVNLSRTAFRAAAMIPLLTVGLAFLWRGMERRRMSTYGLAGACFGLALYSYTAARMALPALVVAALLLRVLYPSRFTARGWVYLWLVLAVVAAPLLVWFTRHPDDALGRMGQVSILGGGGALTRRMLTLLQNAGRVAGAFLWRGDFIPRHNVPLRPVFAPLVALAMVGGLGLTVVRRRQPAYIIPIAWVLLMSVPTLLADDAPHFLRGSGMMPVALMLPATALAALSRWRPGGRWLPGIIGVAVVVGVSAVADLSAYWTHVHGEDAYYQFEAGAAELSAEVNRFRGRGWSGKGVIVPVAEPRSERQVWVDRRLGEGWPSVRFLVPEGPDLGWLATKKPLGDRALLVLWPYENQSATLNAIPTEVVLEAREGARERGDLQPESRLLYVAVEYEPAGALAGVQPLAHWENGVELVDVSVDYGAAQDWLEVTLWWRALETVDTNQVVFCHIMQGDAIIGQRDGPPGGGLWDHGVWRAGQIIKDRRQIRLASAGEKEAIVRVGWYDWRDVGRTPLLFDGLGDGTYYELGNTLIPLSGE